MGDLLLTPKERARMAKVKADLEAGRNPYADTKGKGPVDKGITVKAEISKVELKRREKRWKDGVEGSTGWKGP